MNFTCMDELIYWFDFIDLLTKSFGSGMSENLSMNR